MLKTLRLCLVPDPVLPCLSRLEHDVVEVSLREVLTQGIHPFQSEKSSTLLLALANRLNAEEQIPLAFLDSHYAWPVMDSSVERSSIDYKIGSFLKVIGVSIHFAEDDLSLTQLLELAVEHLRRHWSRSTALEMAKDLHYGFPELRAFLKQKDPSVKLTGYESLTDYDWGRILSVEDFQAHDTLIINQALPRLNLRRKSFLKTITDEQGRLKLRKEIECFSLVDRQNLSWQVCKEGDGYRLFPDIRSDTEEQRAHARTIAERWQTGDSRYCFLTSLEYIERMIVDEGMKPKFNGLGYEGEDCFDLARIAVDCRGVKCWEIGTVLHEGLPVEQLKDVLHKHGRPTSGSKRKVLERLAQLASEQYGKNLPELDKHFRRSKYIRIQSPGSTARRFPVLEAMEELQSLLLSMYVLRHLRGNVILDSRYENDTCTLEQLALGLLQRKVEVKGSFLKVQGRQTTDCKI